MAVSYKTFSTKYFQTLPPKNQLRKRLRLTKPKSFKIPEANHFNDDDFIYNMQNSKKNQNKR